MQNLILYHKYFYHILFIGGFDYINIFSEIITYVIYQPGSKEIKVE